MKFFRLNIYSVEHQKTRSLFGKHYEMLPPFVLFVYKILQYFQSYIFSYCSRAIPAYRVDLCLFEVAHYLLLKKFMVLSKPLVPKLRIMSTVRLSRSGKAFFSSSVHSPST